MWTKAYRYAFTTYVRPNSTRNYGVDVDLFIEAEGRRVIQVKLTSLTEEELVAIKRVIDVAFEASLDSVKARDKIAEEALQDGDTSLGRIFRDPPVIWRREGGTAFEDTLEFLPTGWLGRSSIDPSQQERSIASRAKQEETFSGEEGAVYGEGAEVTDLD
ncbi:hypothetical protein TIN2_63 [Tsukamurella phage TIN2]|uniref:Uncharacterized protein n=1 Tax=Tsukamurella phage TIN2 TaxID=1636545 RepID=A0A0K0N5H9_9CAUD|nr:hypothetical protein AVT55_gp060 [Tsukamurella phage TIN2]AKJ71753.1 hypothetical protein TIN2_63 [Tsukamurella phage TIN2]